LSFFLVVFLVTQDGIYNNILQGLQLLRINAICEKVVCLQCS